MKNIIIVFICAFISLQLSAQSRSFSLDDAIEYAIANSDAKKLTQLELDDAVASVREYTAIGLPKVNGNVNYQYNILKQSQAIPDFISPSVYNVLFNENVLEPRDLGTPETVEFTFNTNHFLSAGIEASSLLFDGSYLVGLEAARMYKDLKTKSIKVTEQEIKANVTRAYLACLILDENEAVLIENIETIGKLESETKTIFEAGFVEQLDVDRLTLTVYNLKNQLVQLQHNKALSKNLLKFQMNFPLEDNITLTEKLLDLFPVANLESVDLDENIDINNRAEFDEFSTAQALNHLDLKRIKKGSLPSLRALAGISGALQRDDLFDSSQTGILPAAYVGLGISVPIYDGNERSAQVQRKRITIEKTDLQISQFTKAVNLEVQNAKISFNNAKQNLLYAERSLDLAQKIFDKSTIKFNEGVGSSLELNQAEQSLFQAQAGYINAIYELVTAKVNIDIASGQL